MLRDATLAALLETLETNDIPFEFNKADNILLMKEARSHILLRSVDEFERLRGTNLAWFGLDELTYTHEGAWLRLEGRLRDPKAVQYCGFACGLPRVSTGFTGNLLRTRPRDMKRFRRRPMKTGICLNMCRTFTIGCGKL